MSDYTASNENILYAAADADYQEDDGPRILDLSLHGEIAGTLDCADLVPLIDSC